METSISGLCHQKNSDWEFLGYFPSDNNEGCERYFVCQSEDEKFSFVPVFFIPSFVFNTDKPNTFPQPALFFHGCDDGHTGISFDTKDDALAWLENCKYVDFDKLLKDYYNNKLDFKLKFHN